MSKRSERIKAAKARPAEETEKLRAKERFKSMTNYDYNRMIAKQNAKSRLA